MFYKTVLAMLIFETPCTHFLLEFLFYDADKRLRGNVNGGTGGDTSRSVNGSSSIFGFAY
jgi:hypothetical protein